VAEANILASKTGEASGEVFNIAAGEKITIHSLVHCINEVLDKEIKPSYSEPRSGDIKLSFADISRARKMLKYEPSVSFKEGLRKTVSWYKERN
jgi:nucleoside-diphosphate-sugar epimerase